MWYIILIIIIIVFFLSRKNHSKEISELEERIEALEVEKEDDEIID